MNCRTHEHRHFERILQTRACLVSTFGSGSVKHPSGYSACIGLSASLPQPSGVLFGVLESRLLGLVSWVGLERRSARRGTQLFVPSAPFKPST